MRPIDDGPDVDAILCARVDITPEYGAPPADTIDCGGNRPSHIPAVSIPDTPADAILDARAEPILDGSVKGLAPIGTPFIGTGMGGTEKPIGPGMGLGEE